MGSRLFKCLFMALVLAAICMSAAMIPTGKMEEAEARRGVKYGKAIVAKARSQIGDPYGYGGSAWTCSELTGWAVNGSTGVYIGYSPSIQQAYGWVPRRPRPGDVMFFDENGYGGPPTHVGIKTGSGIVHASDYFGLVVESDPGYIRGYEGVRRYRP